MVCEVGSAVMWDVSHYSFIGLVIWGLMIMVWCRIMCLGWVGMMEHRQNSTGLDGWCGLDVASEYDLDLVDNYVLSKDIGI